MRLYHTVLLAATFLLASACTSDQAASLDDQHLRLDQRQQAFLEAVAAKDAEKTAAMFADSAVVHVANMPPLEGRNAIRAFYGNMFAFLNESNLMPERTRVSASGDMAYSSGRTANLFEGPEGPVEYEGKYVLVWEEAEGDWHIALYSISSNHE